MKHSAKSFSNLLQEIVTTEDLVTLEQELKILRDVSLSGKHQDLLDAFNTKLRPRIALAIQEDLKEFSEEVRDYCGEAQEICAALPTVELTLAYEPTPEALRRILDKLRTITGSAVIISLMTNPAIMGGAIVVTNGEFRDYSLSARLTSLFQEMYKNDEAI